MNVSNLTIIPTHWVIPPINNPAGIFEASALRIEIDDLGAGAYIRIGTLEGESYVSIDPEEWPLLRRAINQGMRIIAKRESK